MVTILQETLFNETDTKSTKFDELFVEVALKLAPTVKKKFKLSELKEKEKGDEGKVKQIKSLKQFEKALKAGTLLDPNDATNKTKLDRTQISNPPAYFAGFDLPKDNTYISDRFTPEYKDRGVVLLPGLKRALVYEQYGSSPTAKGEQYVYLKIAGKSEMEFVPLKEIGFYEGMNFKTLKSSTQLQSLKEDTVLYLTPKYNNATVEKIYTGATYVFTEIKKDADGKPLVSTIDPTKEGLIDLEGEGDNISFVSRKLGDFISAEYTRPEEIDALPSGATRAQRRAQKEQIARVSEVDSRRYVVNTENVGDYIMVNPADTGEDRMVPISAIRKLDSMGKPTDESVNFEDLQDLIGKSVYVDVDGGFKTKELTAQNVLISYDLPQTLQPSTATTDRKSENAYLQLSDGSMEKEHEVVKPKAYRYARKSETNFDVFVVTTQLPTGEKKDVLVDKDAFNTSSVVNLKFGGSTIEVKRADALPAVRCALKEADVIQTTSDNAMVEDCKVIGEKGKKAAEDARNAAIAEVMDAFLESYKEGKYATDNLVEVRGKLTELADQRGSDYCRFVVKDFLSRPDYGSRLTEYAHLKNVPLKWDGDKLIGGPKYDIKGALAKDYSNFGVLAFNALAFSVGYGGIFAAMISPWILGGAAIALAASAVAIPIFRLIRKAIIEHKKYKYKDKVTVQRKQTKKEIFKELETLLGDTKDLKLDGASTEEKERYKRMFLTRFKSIEDMALTLGATAPTTEFKVRKGEATEINEDNAYLFSEYKTDMQSRAKVVKKLRKKKKLTPQEEKIISDFERDQTECTIMGRTHEQDPEMDEILTTLSRYKGYIFAKFFGERDTLTTDEEQRAIENVELEIKKAKHKIKFKEHKAKKDKTKGVAHKKTNLWKNKVFLQKIVETGERQEKTYGISGWFGSGKKNPAPAKKKRTRKAKTPPVVEEVEVVAQKTAKDMTNEEIEAIVKKVCDAMEGLQILAAGAYGKNDLSPEDETQIEELKNIFEENKSVLKFLVSKRNVKRYKELYDKYGEAINKAGLRYKEYMSIVEGRANVL